MLMITASPVAASNKQKKGAEDSEEGHMGEAMGEGPAEGAEEEMLEEEPPADGMMDALGEAEAIEEGDDEDDASEDDMEMGEEEEEFSPGGSLADARRSAASRAFKQHYGAK